MTQLQQKTGYLADLLKNRISKKRVPLFMEFALTYNCNLRCTYCYGEYGYERKEEISTEKVKEIIDELCSMGTKMIHFTGGEPMLRKDIGEIILHAKKKGLHVGMVSNGLRIKEKIDDIKKLDRLVISLDGREDGHDLNRGKNSYKQAIAAISSCKEHKVNFNLKMVVTKNNVNDIDYVVDFAEKNNTIVEITLLFSQKTETAGNNLDNYRLSKEENLKILEKILKMKREKRSLKINRSIHEYLLRWHKSHDVEKITEEEKQEGFKYQKCYAGIFSGFIHYDGEMFPCNQLLGTFHPKNVLREGVQSAWDHLEKNNCVACSIDFLNEKHFLHDLNLKYLWNVINE